MVHVVRTSNTVLAGCAGWVQLGGWLAGTGWLDLLACLLAETPDQQFVASDASAIEGPVQPGLGSKGQTTSNEAGPNAFVWHVRETRRLREYEGITLRDDNHCMFFFCCG